MASAQQLQPRFLNRWPPPFLADHTDSRKPVLFMPTSHPGALCPGGSQPHSGLLRPHVQNQAAQVSASAAPQPHLTCACLSFLACKMGSQYLFCRATRNAVTVPQFSPPRKRSALYPGFLQGALLSGTSGPICAAGPWAYHPPPESTCSPQSQRECQCPPGQGLQEEALRLQQPPHTEARTGLRAGAIKCPRNFSTHHGAQGRCPAPPKE